MSRCCVIPHTGSPPTCPMSGQATRPVGRKTVESLVESEAMATLTPQPYYFCNASDCDTVYVSALGDHLVTKDMLSVRVGIKETERIRFRFATASGMTARWCAMTSVAKATPTSKDSSRNA